MSRVPVDLGPPVLDIAVVKPGEYFYIYNPPYPPPPNPRPLYEKFKVETVQQAEFRSWAPWIRGWIVNGISEDGDRITDLRIDPGNRMVQAIYSVNPKPMQKAVGEVLTRMTNMSTNPNRGGPPQIIRQFLGVEPKTHSGGTRKKRRISKIQKVRVRSRNMKRNRRR
jgi:hypothetical protein